MKDGTCMKEFTLGEDVYFVSLKNNQIELGTIVEKIYNSLDKDNKYLIDIFGDNGKFKAKSSVSRIFPKTPEGLLEAVNKLNKIKTLGMTIELEKEKLK